MEHSIRLCKRLSIRDIVFRAGSHLSMMHQWAGMHSHERAVHYETKAETLIEMAEVMDCGSVGGFGVGKDYIEKHHGEYARIYLRWYALFRDIMPNYKKDEYLPGANRTLKDLSKFFKMVPNFRTGRR